MKHKGEDMGMFKGKLGVLTLSMAVFGLVACKSDPTLPSDGKLSLEPPVKERTIITEIEGPTVVLPGAPAPVPPILTQPKPLDSPIGIYMDELMRFKEGELMEYPMEIWVESPGLPLLSWDLPDGAFYSPQLGKVSYAPGKGASDDPQDPNSRQRVYASHVELKSTATTVTFVDRDAVFIVGDSPSPVELRIQLPLWNVMVGFGSAQILAVSEVGAPASTFTVKLKTNSTHVSIQPVAGAVNQWSILYTGGALFPPEAITEPCAATATTCFTRFPIWLEVASSTGKGAQVSVVARVSHPK